MKGIQIILPDAEIKRAISNLNKWETQKMIRIDRELAAGALRTETAAKERAPVLTGRLRSSIRTSKERFLSWMVGVFVHYGVWIEIGTTKMNARPFLFPSWEEERPRLLNRIKAILRR